MFIDYTIIITYIRRSEFPLLTTTTTMRVTYWY
jgi:hypothetical protein